MKISGQGNSRAGGPDLLGTRAAGHSVLCPSIEICVGDWSLGLASPGLPSARQLVQPAAGTDHRLEGRRGTSLGYLFPHAHWAVVWQWLCSCTKATVDWQDSEGSSWSQEPYRCGHQVSKAMVALPPGSRGLWGVFRRRAPELQVACRKGSELPALWHPGLSFGLFQHLRNTILNSECLLGFSSPKRESSI